jgi:hypothetical protein
MYVKIQYVVQSHTGVITQNSELTVVKKSFLNI